MPAVHEGLPRPLYLHRDGEARHRRLRQAEALRGRLCHRRLALHVLFPLRRGLPGQLHLPHRGVRSSGVQSAGARQAIRRAARRSHGGSQTRRASRYRKGRRGLIIAFFFLAGMTLVSALGVVVSRNVVHSALFMSGSFLGIAGFFVMLNAPALAAFQVLIYVGAVTVLMLFGIMFTQNPQARRYRTIINRQFWAGLFVAAGVGAFLAYVLSAEDWGGVEAGNGPRQVADLGRDLLGVSPGAEIFTLLFEVVSVLLLVAIVGAIVISRRKSGAGIDRRAEE